MVRKKRWHGKKQEKRRKQKNKGVEDISYTYNLKVVIYSLVSISLLILKLVFNGVNGFVLLISFWELQSVFKVSFLFCHLLFFIYYFYSC